jgi:hypothetical protein
VAQAVGYLPSKSKAPKFKPQYRQSKIETKQQQQKQKKADTQDSTASLLWLTYGVKSLCMAPQDDWWY